MVGRHDRPFVVSQAGPNWRGLLPVGDETRQTVPRNYTSSTLPSVSDSASSIARSVCRFTSHFLERWHAMSSSYRLLHCCILFYSTGFSSDYFQHKVGSFQTKLSGSFQTKLSVAIDWSHDSKSEINFCRNHVVDFCTCARVKVTGCSLLINIHEKYYLPFLRAGTSYSTQ